MLLVAAVAGCGRKEGSPSRKDGDPSADASVPVDARWRSQEAIGFASDLIPLLERDCPKDAPLGYNAKTGIGKEVVALGWFCNAYVRPGVLRYLDAHLTETSPLTVRYVWFGYEWDVGQQRPPECEHLQQHEAMEYITTVVKNADGVPLSDRDRVRVKLLVDDFGGHMVLSTGPIKIDYGTRDSDRSGRGDCKFSIEAPMDGTPYDWRRDAGLAP